MKKFHLTILLITLLFIAHSVSADTGAYKIFKQGLELEQECRILKARDKFREAISMDPFNHGYLTHYGWFLHYHGFSEEAVAVFKKTLPLAEDKSSVAAGLAWNLKAIGQQKLHRPAYGLIIKSKSTEPSPKDQYSEKIRSLKLEISESPNPVKLQKKLFNTYIDNNEFDSAIRTAEDLRSSNTLDKLTQLQLARILFWNSKKQQSEIEYRLLIKESPDSAFLYYELAGLLDVDGRLDEALEALEESLKIYPDAPATKKRLAEVLAQMGRDSDAEKVASSINPSDSAGLTGLLAKARALHFSGRLAEAQEAYKIVLNEYPYNNDALWGMTETSIYTGKHKSARTTITKWEKVGPDPRLENQRKLLAQSSSPVVEAQAEYYTNSSDFTRKNYGADLSFLADDDLRLRTGYTYSDFYQDGYNDVKRHSIFLQGNKDVSEQIELTGRVAISKYDNDNTNINGSIAIQLHPSNSFRSEIGYRHFDITDTVLPFNNTLNSYVATIGSVGLNIKSDDYRLYLFHSPLPGVSLAGEYVFGKYSDGNTKQTIMFYAGYQILHNPDLRAAYTYFYLDLKDPAVTFTEGIQNEAAYWDPINFGSHTIRLEYRDNYNKDLSYGAKAALAYIPKSQGNSRTLSAFISYKVRKNLSLRLDARNFYQNKGIDRVGTTGYFRADNYNMSLQYKF